MAPATATAGTVVTTAASQTALPQATKFPAAIRGHGICNCDRRALCSTVCAKIITIFFLNPFHLSDFSRKSFQEAGCFLIATIRTSMHPGLFISVLCSLALFRSFLVKY